MENNPFANSIMELRYSWDKPDGSKENWRNIAERVIPAVFSVVDFPQKKSIVEELVDIVGTRKFIPGGRFLAQSGRDYHQTNNCFLLRAEDSREGWGDLLGKAAVMLMSGGGIGVDYSDIRPNGASLKRSGGTSSGPIPLMKSVNEVGRGVMAGGKRRSAIWAGLRWNHKDIFEFITLKNWIPEVRKLKEKDFEFPAPMDMTNISVILDRKFFDAYYDILHSDHQLAHDVYWQVIKRMLKTAEPGFSVDFLNPRESLRNACTEIVSEDDSDACCLGSANLARIHSLDELKRVSELGELFLLLGTLYSDTPTEKIKQVRDKNRRTGYGLMGMHEWLIQRNLPYKRCNELASWLQVWKDETENSGNYWADRFSLNRPRAKRGIAPNGSTSIAGGMTTSGIEPVYATAYQRRYMTPDGWKKQYVVDYIVENYYKQGYDVSKIEDSISIGQDFERRIDFQAFVQEYVDNAISSTVNLPSFDDFGSQNIEKFGNTLIKYLPKLRGITVYPDGSRGGQPLTPVDFEFAISKKGVVFEGNEDCSGGACGF